MNDKGKNIVCGFGKLRKFCHEVSLLLKSAQDLMKDEDWNRAKPDDVFYTRSGIDDHEWWLPQEVCRFFENPDFPRLSCYIAVIVDDPDEKSPVEYALISAGCIVFRPGMRRDKLEHWMSHWHLLIDSRKDDGSPCRDDEPQKTGKPKQKGDEEPPASFLRVTTFAYPLDKIANCKTLNEKIVLPLWKVIEEEGKSIKAKTR